jgi:hypothetical protein
MNFFTPELGPPLASTTDLEDWRRRVTDYLNGLRQVIDTQMIAFISDPAQFADRIIGGQQISLGTFAQQTANLAIGASTMLVFNVANSSPLLASPSCTSAGWFVSMAGSTTAVQRVNVLNQSGSTAGATVYLRYFP